MAPEPDGQAGDAPLPCIIDTDVAIDDWMAMLFLLCHPQVNVQAITVAATGEAHAKPGVRTVQGLLALAGNIEALSPKIDNPHAEWSIFCDPYAADVVLRCGAPITLVPLDATDQVPLTDDLVQRLAAGPTTPAGQFVLRAIRRIRPLLRGQAFYLWDPLAAAVAVHPEVVTCEQRRVAVMQEPGRELGRVVEDGEGGVVDIAVQVDRPAFERAFVASLTGAWRNER